MSIEFEGSRQTIAPAPKEASLLQSRPATFNLIALVSQNVPSIDDRRLLFERAMASATFCSDLDGELVQKLGARSVLELKAATASLSEDPEVAKDFPDQVRRNAVKWANRRLEDLQVRAELEEREERRMLAPINREIHISSQKPWSNVRVSGLPRGDGRYSKDERPRRAKRHNGRLMRP